MNNITLTIGDMSCGHCVKAIQSALSQLPGVLSVNVSLEQKNAQISYDPAQATPEQMITAIAEAGFSASL